MQRLFFPRLFAALVGVGLFALTHVPALAADGEAGPRRIVSANLCADQLVLALADKDQIASLSPSARDPALSFFADRARALPMNRGSGEDIIESGADLVIVGPYDSRYTRELLTRQGIAFLSLDPWTSFAQGEAQVRSLAARLGHPERGEALVASIESALARARAAMPVRERAPTFLVLHRRGFVFHAGLTGDVAELAGLRDDAPAMGIGTAGFVSMEALVAARPDYLIVADDDVTAEDEGQAFLRHPALAALWPANRRLIAPDHLTICDGPSTPALIDSLLGEIKTKVR